jgi:hypothetical protein
VRELINPANGTRMRIGVGTTEAKVTYSSTLSSALISETWSPLLGWDANANATLRD